MTNKLIVLNNKCHFNKKEFLLYIEELKKINNGNIVICPSSCYLSLVDDITLGSQDVSSYNNGAYTGEVSAEQLKSLNVKYCLVGHYERILYNHESINDIKNKIFNLLNNDITPIVCVSEKNTIENLDILLSDVTDKTKIIIAYEPTYAIGGHELPTKEHIEEVFNLIKEKYNDTKLLYGGSITSDNINIIKDINTIDGYLLGNLSLDISNLDKFLQVL